MIFKYQSVLKYRWVSISSEVGSNPIKVGSCNTSRGIRPLPLGGGGFLRPVNPENFGIQRPGNALSSILASNSVLNID